MTGLWDGQARGRMCLGGSVRMFAEELHIWIWAKQEISELTRGSWYHLIYWGCGHNIKEERPISLSTGAKTSTVLSAIRAPAWPFNLKTHTSAPLNVSGAQAFGLELRLTPSAPLSQPADISVFIILWTTSHYKSWCVFMCICVDMYMHVSVCSVLYLWIALAHVIKYNMNCCDHLSHRLSWSISHCRTTLSWHINSLKYVVLDENSRLSMKKIFLECYVLSLAT